MLWLYALVLLLCGAAILFLFPGIMWLEIRRTFAGTRQVQCPETKEQVRVKLNANAAASRVFSRSQTIEIAGCTRWPEKQDCAQMCIPEAVSKNRPSEFMLNHIGVIVAALVSWAVVGGLRAFYPVRSWMAESGYSTAVLHERIMSVPPALAFGFGCLIISYVTTWIMRRTHMTGLIAGTGIGVLLWAATVGATVPEVVMEIPWRIFVMNTLFNLLAFLICGALLGILVVPTQAPTASSDEPLPRPARRPRRKEAVTATTR